MDDLKHSKIETGLLQIRDSLIDLVTGVDRDQVLNSGNGSSRQDAYTDPAMELKRALDLIKISVISEEGSQVNFDSLRESKVYKEFRRECSPKLRGFDPGRLDQREEQLAFWINLYNALVLDAVIAFGVQHSVTEGWLGLLAFFRKAAYNVGGQRLSLDDIEHGILRGNRGHPALPGPQFTIGDPRLDWVITPADVRIHFALNCASRSCPPIQVYSGNRIEAQLELAARNFVHETTTLNQTRKEISVSTIFHWYEGDFGWKKGVVNFILDHLPEDERQTWISANLDSLHLDYKPYDWGLNTYLV